MLVTESKPPLQVFLCIANYFATRSQAGVAARVFAYLSFTAVSASVGRGAGAREVRGRMWMRAGGGAASTRSGRPADNVVDKTCCARPHPFAWVLSSSSSSWSYVSSRTPQML